MLQSFLTGMDVAIGMEFKSIPDSAISASSMESTTFHPRNARLHQNIGGGGWCAQETLLDQPQYLQVDLERNWALIAVATQGIQSMESWVTQYYLSTTFDRKVWVFAHDFTGKKVKALLKVMTFVTRSLIFRGLYKQQTLSSKLNKGCKVYI